MIGMFIFGYVLGAITIMIISVLTLEGGDDDEK